MKSFLQKMILAFCLVTALASTGCRASVDIDPAKSSHR
jgi:hypothetical protein